MKVHTFPQGTPEWHQHRAKHFNASDAPAMMNLSRYPNATRDALLYRVKTGVEDEVTPEMQRLFDKGHRDEAAARPYADELTGVELFPVTGSREVDGLSLSASFDGMDEFSTPYTIAWEHKSLNQDLAEEVPVGELHVMYRIQMEHQLLVCGLDKCLFMASEDGNRDTAVYTWYVSDPKLRADVIAGWKQFAKDLETYEPASAPEVIVGEVYTSLPAAVVSVEGQVKSSNLPAVRDMAEAFVERLSENKFETDQDFADAENAEKILKEGETQMDQAMANTIAQIPEVDMAFKEMRAIKKMFADIRLPFGKKVVEEKNRRKQEYITAAKAEIRAHINALEDEFDFEVRIADTADYTGVIKNKRTVSSIQNALNSEVARVKIEVDAAASVIRKNIKALDERGHYFHLFGDLPFVVQKPHDDFINLLESRIAQAEEVERKKQEAEKASEHKKAIEATIDFNTPTSAPEVVAAPENVPHETIDEPVSDADLLIEWADSVQAKANNLPSLDNKALQRYVGVRYKRIIDALDEIYEKVKE